MVSNVALANRTSGIAREQSGRSVERNTATGNGASGIYSINSHGAFVQNVMNANGGDGLRIVDTVFDHGPLHSVTGNVANA